MSSSDNNDFEEVEDSQSDISGSGSASFDDHESEENYSDDDDFQDPVPKKKNIKTNTETSKKKISDDIVVKATPQDKKPTTTKARTVSSTQKMEKESPTKWVNLESAGSGNPVLDYLRSTNRPYSLINIYDNLHKALPKTVMQRSLDALEKSKEIVAKTYGKSKIYYINQDNATTAADHELVEMQEKIKILEEQDEHQKQIVKVKEKELRALLEEPTKADLDEQLSNAEKNLEKWTQKMEDIRNSTRPPVSPRIRENLKKKFNLLRTTWVKRRRIVIDSVDQISEGLEKKPTEIHELCGIETDEALDVAIPDI